MSMPTWWVRRLHALDDSQIEALAGVLIDCVEGGAGVSFMHPLSRDRAVEFWRGVAQGVATGERALLVADDAHGLCGTVQLRFDLPENQPHRSDLSKMLVHRRARRQGVGAALVRAAEATARECGKTLLVLDAVTGGDAARLYERLGWVRAGEIPGYALMPMGGLSGTTVFYRELGRCTPQPGAAAKTQTPAQTNKTKASVTELPFNSFLGIEKAAERTELLRLPAGAQYLNHLGTVHASAQLALAEASSGEFLLRAFADSSGVIPVVRRFEAKFRKPANGAVASTVSAPPAAFEQLHTALAEKGRAIVSVTVELHDESGAHTLSATVEWFITRIPDPARKQKHL